jgi:hypothetical protein
MSRPTKCKMDENCKHGLHIHQVHRKESQWTGSVNSHILSLLVTWQNGGGAHLKYHPALRYVQSICTSEHKVKVHPRTGHEGLKG